MGSSLASPEQTAERARLRAALLSLGVGTLMLVGKLVAWQITGSSAVLSDAMESVVNVVAGGMLVFVILVASRPVDRDHPYGHGKVEFFSAGIEGALIAVAAILILVESVREIVRGPELQNIENGLVLLVALSVVNAALGFRLIHVGKMTHSTALIADGRHVLTDVWTTAGVVVGLVAVRLTGWTLLDPLVAIAVGLHILYAGWLLVRESIGRLMDEADEPLLDEIRDALEDAREPGWIEAHRLRAFRTGRLIHADLHFTVPRYWDVQRLHDMDDVVTRAVLSPADGHGDVVVHYDPCISDDCSGCAMPDCSLRSAPLAVEASLHSAGGPDEEPRGR